MIYSRIQSGLVLWVYLAYIYEDYPEATDSLRHRLPDLAMKQHGEWSLAFDLTEHSLDQANKIVEKVWDFASDD